MTKNLDYCPGGVLAIDLGCTCPVLDNDRGRGHAGNGDRWGWWINDTCELHKGKPWKKKNNT